MLTQTEADALIEVRKMFVKSSTISLPPGAVHTNPDGTRLGGTHLHLYREGFEDRWAFPVDPAKFHEPTNLSGTFHDFCSYCNIFPIPPFQEAVV